MSRPGKVILCGAGPGDPELVSLKTVRRLQEADLVLYDALVHPDLLRHAEGAELVFVGKRAGRPSERQDRINERMLEAARAGKNVVRLKGGDPYLFGRGSEEAEHLAAHGIAFEVVPGVPSPLAATSYAGISLTHRSRSSSVAYITATESVMKDRSSHRWEKLATGPETLVIFMGMRKLPSLMQLLIEHGRDPDTPAAVVQNASRPQQRCVVGTISTIAEKARAEGLGLPALTIVGDVVELRASLRWYDAQPLFGKRVLVTRPAHQSDELARLLRDEGAEPVLTPAIRIVEPSDPSRLRRAVQNMNYGWVVFTSANGVERFFSEVDRQGQDARVLGGAKVCAIGPATSATLLAHGIRADVVPSEFKGEDAAAAIIATGDISDVRVLLPRAEVAREALPDLLRAAGAEVDVVPAYRTVGAAEDDAIQIRDAIFRKTVDIITFTSPSTVREVANALGQNADALADFTIACIGPITAAAVQDRGWPVFTMPKNYTAPGLVAALRESFS